MATFPLTEKQAKRYANFAKSNGSGYIGVNWCEPAKKWKAAITDGGKYIQIGLFDKAIDAAVARDNKAMELWGCDAVTNYGLGLIKDTDDFVLVRDDDKIKEKINRSLPPHLRFLAGKLFAIVTFSKDKGTTFSEIMKSDSKMASLSKRERVRILNSLEREGIIFVDKKIGSPDKGRIYQISYKPKELAKGINMNIKQDTTATKEKSYSLDSKTPEELAKMAEELLALSEAKKKEIANADTIKKRLNPLILNCFQAKGKVERALNELLDVTTDLDNALNALRDAMK